jgi:energy-coupling factor transporter ATP-binding protein EcfA2
MSETVKNATSPVASLATPVTTVSRIAKISLSDYRAFPSGQTYEFNLGPEGRNLLLFGENGSGKTSLFRALRDLATLKPGPTNFADFRHIFSPGDEGFISIQLTAGTPSEFRWDYDEKHPRETAGQPYNLLAERCRFLDYKALLETNFVHRANKPDLFDLLVREVLFDLPVIVGGKADKLGRVYNRMNIANPKNYHGINKLKAVDKACADFNAALANHLPEVVAEGRFLVSKMGYDGLDFDLKPGTVTYDRKKRKFTGQEIGLSVTLFSKPIDHPQIFLNEARLTALALAIYLGGARLVLKSPKAGADGTIKVRLLVLDDVLIGLDLANRLPVLKILNDDFPDWQIILMTYDQVWFELAREFTEHMGHWTTLNLREIQTVSGQPGRPHIEACPELLAIAEKHFQTDDLMATAVYLRASFETRIKNVCNDNGIKIAYKRNIKDIKADHLWQGIVDRQKEREKEGRANFILPALLADVETVRSTVLNKLSHSGTPQLFKSEVKFALETIKKLQNHEFKRA